MRGRFIDFRAIVPGPVEQKPTQNALRIEEIGMGSGDVAKRRFRSVGLRGIDENHRPLELQDGVARIVGNDFVHAGDCIIVPAVLRRELGEDEFVGIAREFLRRPRRGEKARDQEHVE